jgi:hypothetical protein
MLSASWLARWMRSPICSLSWRMPLVSPRVVRLAFHGSAAGLADGAQRFIRQLRQQMFALRLHDVPGHPKLVGGSVVAVFFLLQDPARVCSIISRFLPDSRVELDQFLTAALEQRARSGFGSRRSSTGSPRRLTA